MGNPLSRVLILTSSTGGGHDMRARSLVHWAKQDSCADLKIEASVHATLESNSRLYRFGVGLYNAIQRHAPWFHHIYFHYLEWAGMHLRAEGLRDSEAFRELLLEIRPQVIVSVHAHLNHAYFELAREVLGRDEVRCVTYCGELYGGYGFSQHWVNAQADLFVGAVAETVAQAEQLGMPRERALVGGFMLHSSFYEPTLPLAQRQEWMEGVLGFAEDLPIVLLATGANAANNHLVLLEQLRPFGGQLRVVVLCGKNEETRQQVEQWSQQHSNLGVKALGYTEEMARLLDVASWVVARAGTGTTSEALLRNCPMVFNGMGTVMPQEYITTRYAQSHGFGRTFYRANQFGRIVEEYLRRPAALFQEKQAMVSAVPVGSPRQVWQAVLGERGEY